MESNQQQQDMTTANQSDGTSKSRKKNNTARLIILALILIGGGYYGFKKWEYISTHETTDNAQIETSFVPVISRVSGYVKSVHISDYDSVRTGALLAEVDDAEMQLQLQQMEADYIQAAVDVANAKAALKNATISLEINRGNIELGKIRQNQALEDYNRNKKLHDADALTTRQLTDSRYAFELAQQQAKNTETDLLAATSKLEVLQTTVDKAEAVLVVKKSLIDQQKLKLSYTKIFAPQSGKIGRKNVAVGQYVQAGMPLCTVVTDTTFWVVANFKENQIEKFYPGMEVEISMEAYPLKVKGFIESLSDATGAKFALLPPDNASGNFVKVTQRIPVKIAIKDVGKYKQILKAGLSVSVEVSVGKSRY